MARYGASEEEMITLDTTLCTLSTYERTRGALWTREETFLVKGLHIEVSFIRTTGGYTEELLSMESLPEISSNLISVSFSYFLCAVFCSHNFFPASEKWERISWKGEGPKPKTGHFMWIDGGHLYICCGEDSAEMDVNFNEEGFWRIDLDKVVAHQVEWERVSLKHTSLSVHFLDGVQAKVGAHVFFLMSRQMHVYTPSEGEVRVVSAAPAESQSCMVALDGVLYLVPEKSFNYCECSTLSSFVFFKLHYTLFTRFFLHFIVFIVTLPTWSLGGEI